MGVKQQVALEVICDCDDCARSDIGPLIGRYAGETIGECSEASSSIAVYPEKPR